MTKSPMVLWVNQTMVATSNVLVRARVVAKTFTSDIKYGVDKFFYQDG